MAPRLGLAGLALPWVGVLVSPVSRHETMEAMMAVYRVTKYCGWEASVLIEADTRARAEQLARGVDEMKAPVWALRDGEKVALIMPRRMD